jgi:hypothetical protein
VHPYSHAAAPPDPIVASLPDGRQLPVIDIAHPAFAVTLTDDQLEARARAFDAEAAARGTLSSAMLAALAQSTLGRAMMAASGSYLGGLATYVFKLGPEHLGSCDSPVDRGIADTFPALTLRVRLQDVSRLLADGLAPALRSGDPGRPLLLLNIAGGVAADDWNALLLLHRQRPSLVGGRGVTIAVLDLDREGPAFGAAAVAALTAPARPLENVTVAFRPVVYDWSSPDSSTARTRPSSRTCGRWPPEPRVMRSSSAQSRTTATARGGSPTAAEPRRSLEASKRSLDWRASAAGPWNP